MTRMITMTEAIEMELKRLRKQIKPTAIAKDLGVCKTTAWRYLVLLEDNRKIPFEFIKALEEKGYIFPTKIFIEHFRGK